MPAGDVVSAETRCCCKHIGARECYRFRYKLDLRDIFDGPDARDDEDDEVCECTCHDTTEDDEDCE